MPAFVAAMSGKQVAVIGPTTLLARQHHRNFVERFQGMPLRIGPTLSLYSRQPYGLSDCLDHDLIRLNQIVISSLCLSMVFSENRYPLSGSWPERLHGGDYL